MKTLLLLIGLSLNILLCFYPFESLKQNSLPAAKTAEESHRTLERPERKPLDYSALLKNKASHLPGRSIAKIKL